MQTAMRSPGEIMRYSRKARENGANRERENCVVSVRSMSIWFKDMVPLSENTVDLLVIIVSCIKRSAVSMPHFCMIWSACGAYMQQSLHKKCKKAEIVQYVYFMSNYFSYFGYCMSCILGEIAVSLIHQRKPIQTAIRNPARSRRGGRPAFTCSYHLFSLLLRQLRSIGAKLFFCLKRCEKEKIKKFCFSSGQSPNYAI